MGVVMDRVVEIEVEVEVLRVVEMWVWAAAAVSSGKCGNRNGHRRTHQLLPREVCFPSGQGVSNKAYARAPAWPMKERIDENRAACSDTAEAGRDGAGHFSRSRSRVAGWGFFCVGRERTGGRGTGTGTGTGTDTGTCSGNGCLVCWLGRVRCGAWVSAVRASGSNNWLMETGLYEKARVSSRFLAGHSESRPCATQAIPSLFGSCRLCYRS